MNKEAKNIIAIGAVVLPILGYGFNIIVKKNAKKIIETETIDTGRYKDSPVYGKKAIEMAHSFERVALMILVFSLLFSLLCLAILYINI